MQQEIKGDIHLSEHANSFTSTLVVKSIDHTSSFDNTDLKISKLKKLIERGGFNKNVAKYIPGVQVLTREWMLYNILTKERSGEPNYTDGKNLEFNKILPANHYTNCKRRFVSDK